MGFLEGLTIVFVTLKLTGVIAWSWFWVLFPMYPALLMYAIFFGMVILKLFFGVSRKSNQRRRRR